jgi:hypothetical protein
MLKALGDKADESLCLGMRCRGIFLKSPVMKKLGTQRLG